MRRSINSVECYIYFVYIIAAFPASFNGLRHLKSFLRKTTNERRPIYLFLLNPNQTRIYELSLDKIPKTLIVLQSRENVVFDKF